MKEMSNPQQQNQRKGLIEQDKLNRQIPFHPKKTLSGRPIHSPRL